MECGPPVEQRAKGMLGTNYHAGKGVIDLTGMRPPSRALARAHRRYCTGPSSVPTLQNGKQMMRDGNKHLLANVF
jgi:hypothetical protein